MSSSSPPSLNRFSGEGAPPQDYFRFAAYGEYNAPWEIATPQPTVLKAVSKGGVFEPYIKKGATVVDLCCGVGRNSILFASLGCHVTGIDFNEIAVKRANANWEAAKAKMNKTHDIGDAEFLVGSLLDLTTASLPRSTFDIIIDTAAFHVFSKEDRVKYTQTWAALSHPGSHMLFLNFSDPPEYPGVGPLHSSEDELRDQVFTVNNCWEIVHFERSTYTHEASGSPFAQPAWLVIAKRI